MNPRCAACGAPTAGQVLFGEMHRACVERLLAGIIKIDDAGQRRGDR